MGFSRGKIVNNERVHEYDGVNDITQSKYNELYI